MVSVAGSTLIRTRKVPVFQITARPFPASWEKPQAAKSQSSEVVLRLGVQLQHPARRSDSAAAHSRTTLHNWYLSPLLIVLLIQEGIGTKEKRKPQLNHHLDQFPFLPKPHKITAELFWGNMKIYCFISNNQEQ